MALSRQQLRAAALDVFHTEPLSHNHKLLSLNNFYATPHIGAYTEQAFEKASLEAAQKLIYFLKKQQVSDTLPPQAAWYLDL